jgi:DNA-binding CsgD family transcriptional regulator
LVLDPEVARDAFSDAPAGAPRETLTDREKEVFQLIAEGSSSKEVAQLLDLSVKTALRHREHLMEKLQVQPLRVGALGDRLGRGLAIS